MIKRTLMIAIAMTLTANVVHADSNKLSKPEGAGMLTGAATGAIVGGPIGAFVGFMIGGIIGDSVDHAQTAEQRALAMEEELLQARRELAAASREREVQQDTSSNAAMFAGLAERMRADVMFRTNSSALDVPTQMHLKDLGTLLAAHPQLSIEVHGFADPRGKLRHNQELSRVRAEQVRSALLFGGASMEQVSVLAHGEQSASAVKGDLEAYAWDRRVSMVITPSAQGQVAQSR